jgi:hypothetical protein
MTRMENCRATPEPRTLQITILVGSDLPYRQPHEEHVISAMWPLAQDVRSAM